MDFTSVHVEIENVVLEINWNANAPISQNDSQSLTNFAVNWDHVSTIMHRIENLVILLHAISAALHNSLCTPMILPFRDRSKPFSSCLWNCQAPTSGTHSSLAVRQNPPSEPKFSGNAFTAVCVQVHLHPFKPLRTTHGTKIQNLLVKMSLWNCHTLVHKPSCDPTELQSSKLQPSIHWSHFQPSFQEVSVEHVQIPEWLSLPLISSFQALRDHLSMFLPLCEPLAPWIAPLVLLDFPLNCPLFS